jgi:hypothetical protein
VSDWRERRAEKRAARERAAYHAFLWKQLRFQYGGNVYPVLEKAAAIRGTCFILLET